MRMWAILIAFLFLGAVPAGAEQSAGAAATPPAANGAVPSDAAKAAKLDGLFDKLRKATPVEGRIIEGAILRQWLESGDPDTDQVMAEAMAAMEEGNLQVALKYLDTLVAARPDYVEAWNKRATIYFYLNEYDKSLADIARTLALEPRHFGALAGLGMIRLNQGDKQGALDAFERAVAVDPALDNIQGVISELKDQLGKRI